MSPACPKCQSTKTTTQYSDPISYFCRACSHEWREKGGVRVATPEEEAERVRVMKDSEALWRVISEARDDNDGPYPDTETLVRIIIAAGFRLPA